MLDQFQLAFADLVASPELVSQVRVDPKVLRDRYELTDLEWRRLIGVVNQPGMECNCMLYRANRLVPVALNLPDLSKVLRNDLRDLLSEYWAHNTHTNDNFLIEAYHFCVFVEDKINAGFISGKRVLPVLKREMAAISKQLEEIYPERYASAASPLSKSRS